MQPIVIPSSPPAGDPQRPADAAPLYNGVDFEADESVGHLLALLTLAMRREVDLRMARHGLTDAQWKPLWLLQRGLAATPQELSRCTFSDAGAMTRLLDRLVAKGLVERERSDTDRRVVQLRLTPAGDTAAAEVPPVLADVNNQFLRGFSQAEWLQLRGLLGRMAVNAQALRQQQDATVHNDDAEGATP